MLNDNFHAFGQTKDHKASTNHPLSLFIIFALLVLGGACAPALPPTSAPIKATAMKLKLVSDGRERSYGLLLPSSLDAGQLPLLILLHGIGSMSGAMDFQNFGLAADSERFSFIGLEPDAAGDGRAWNAGGCCGDAVTKNIDDVGFIKRLIDQTSSQYRVDPQRIYVYGFSSGGLLAYRLACEMSDRIAAIAVSSGSMVVDQCLPTKPVSVIHFHGMSDTIVLYHGGKGQKPFGYEWVPIPTIIEQWRELDGCTALPVVERVGDVTITSSKDCRDGTEVRLYASKHGTHSVPLGFFSSRLKLKDQAFEFFAAHPKNP